MALQFFTQCILLGVFKIESEGWIGLLNHAHGDLIQLFGAFIHMLGMSTMFLFFIRTMPSWVGNTLAGEIRLQLNDKLSGVAGFMSGGGHG